ncbi:MAG: MBL fold metallo-hydrolase [Rhizobiaceae bacterium]|nr:MBL fold metallo-hydrolase [Rhizobiaceae bacterium]
MMSDSADRETRIDFRTEFEPRHGEAVGISHNIVRVTCPNPGPFTFHGTNSYILGNRSVAVIDPGPMDESHLQALLQAINKRDVSHIIVTHTHVDHSPLARRLKQITGAPILAEGPHRPARDLHLGETNVLDASADREFEPDRNLRHGERVEGDGFALEAVFTPGHTENHMAFALVDEDLLFSGDHVMAWATSIVAPPDGSMQNYMASLQTLMERGESRYLPGHGGQLNNAREFVRALRAHRIMRESAILARIRAGDRTIPELVKVIYRDTDPRLHGAAALSVLAHIEDLMEKGRIASNGPASLEGEYLPNA